MNTISREQYNKLEQVCAAYAAANDIEHEFHSIILCGEEGDGPEPWESAYSLLFEVYDFDNQHDFLWLESMLDKAGVALNKSKLGQEPHTNIVTGDGEIRLAYTSRNCRIYGYQLALEK